MFRPVIVQTVEDAALVAMVARHRDTLDPHQRAALAGCEARVRRQRPLSPRERAMLWRLSDMAAAA